MNDSKRYYSINEVSEITGLGTHILRYWEKQFSFLKIQRDPSGRRIYSDKDVEKIKEIQKLLYQNGYKIVGVKKKFRSISYTQKQSRQNSSLLLKKILRYIKEIERCLP